MKVEIYSDVVCPWCYVGERRFFRALGAAADVEVVFRPYQLDPRAPEAATPLLPSLAEKFGARADAIVRQVTDAAASAGIEMRWDRALAVNTFRAHRLVWLAEREYGAAVQHALVERLFAAHFTEGLDVGDPAQLAAIAAAAGLDAARAAALLASDEGTAEVRAMIGEARTLGVDAVPTFVFDGKWAVPGAQPEAVFRQVLDEVRAERDRLTSA